MKKIAVLAGDGIGPELTEACMPVLERAASRSSHNIEWERGLVGWAAYDALGDMMPEETWRLCIESNAMLLGTVGLPDRDQTVWRVALSKISRKFNLKEHDPFISNNIGGIVPAVMLNRETGMGLYKPKVDSSLDIAGKGTANPIGMILAIALMFEYTFKDTRVATDIQGAVKRSRRHALTPDLGGTNTTREVVHAVLGELD